MVVSLRRLTPTTPCWPPSCEMSATNPEGTSTRCTTGPILLLSNLLSGKEVRLVHFMLQMSQHQLILLFILLHYGKQQFFNKIKQKLLTSLYFSRSEESDSTCTDLEQTMSLKLLRVSSRTTGTVSKASSPTSSVTL